jgi:hypothetical protein
MAQAGLVISLTESPRPIPRAIACQRGMRFLIRPRFKSAAESLDISPLPNMAWIMRGILCGLRP